MLLICWICPHHISAYTGCCQEWINNAQSFISLSLSLLSFSLMENLNQNINTQEENLEKKIVFCNRSEIEITIQKIITKVVRSVEHYWDQSGWTQQEKVHRNQFYKKTEADKTGKVKRFPPAALICPSKYGLHASPHSPHASPWQQGYGHTFRFGLQPLLQQQ